MRKVNANSTKNGARNGSRNGFAKYREILLAKKTELLAPLRSKLDMFAGPGRGAVEDLAPVFHDQFVALQVNRVGFQQLKLVDAALERIDSHEYGICLSCGEPISSKRLEAIPWAICCVDCQERLSSGPGLAQPIQAFA